MNIDDTLDVFAVPGRGGIIGTLMVAVLAVGFLGGGGVKVADGSIRRIYPDPIGGAGPRGSRVHAMGSLIHLPYFEVFGSGAQRRSG